MNYKDKITIYEGYPKAGISFKDINSLLLDPKAYQSVINDLYDLAKPLDCNVIISPESRGYILGCPLAYKMGVGFVPIRKPGKLPGEVVSITYDLEYGTDTLEIQQGAIKPGDRVLIVDDLIATGGTLKAMIEMTEKLGGEIAGVICLIELTELKGKDLISDYPFYSIVQYDV